MRTIAYLVGGLVVLVGSFLITNWFLSRNDGVNWKFTDEASLAAAAKAAGYHLSKDLGGHVDTVARNRQQKCQGKRLGCRYFWRWNADQPERIRQRPQHGDLPHRWPAARHHGRRKGQPEGQSRCGEEHRLRIDLFMRCGRQAFHRRHVSNEELSPPPTAARCVPVRSSFDGRITHVRRNSFRLADYRGKVTLQSAGLL